MTAATWTPTTGGYCESNVECGGRSSATRARWTGPVTPTGGNLYCGKCKRAAERAADACDSGSASPDRDSDPGPDREGAHTVSMTTTDYDEDQVAADAAYRDFAGPNDGDAAFCDDYVAHDPHTYRALNGTHYRCVGMTVEDLAALEADLARVCEHGLSESLCAGPGHYPPD